MGRGGGFVNFEKIYILCGFLVGLKFYFWSYYLMDGRTED